jgi:hypothetical protein
VIHWACGQPFFERITPRLLQQLLPHLQGKDKQKGKGRSHVSKPWGMNIDINILLIAIENHCESI